MKSLWLFLKEHVTLLTTIWAAATTLYGIFLTRRLLQTKAEPSITYAQINVEPFDLPSFRVFNGSFVAVNSGRKRCNLMWVQVLHESLNFDISNITDQRNRGLTAHDKCKIDEQLPLAINGNKTKRILFAGLHKVATYDELPETLSLKVTFDCRKEPVLLNLIRKLEIKKYGLYQL